LRIPFTNIYISRRSSSLSNPQKWLVDMFGGYQSKSGITVTEDTAIKVVAVFACVRLLSEQIASLPLPLYRKTDKGKEKAYNHPLYSVLNEIANPEQTAFEFWQMMMVNMLLTPYGYAEIVRDEGGNIIELWPIPTNRVVPDRNPRTKEPMYHVTFEDGTYDTLYPENMLCIQGLRMERLNPYEPIELARECIGLSLAAEEYGSSYFANGAHPSGIIEYTEKLKGEALDDYKKEMRKAYAGLGNSHRLMLLENGSKFNKITAPPEEAQMLETRKHQVVEAARFFNVPPHKIMDMDRATFSNIEELNISFAQDTLVPWCIKIKQAVSKDLLTSKERKKYFAEHNLGALMRGNMESRYTAYAVGRNWGWLSVNEIRELENMNTIPEGDVYLQPLNMVPAGEEIPVIPGKGGNKKNGQGKGNAGEGAAQ
jgi:HK97 family phage portal protein